ncbi:MAG: hypothetical protein ABFS08_07900 [Pseudomonadota bacterium]
MKKIILNMFLTLSLMGCSGGPEKSDIEVALKDMMIDGVEFALERDVSAPFLGVMGLNLTKNDLDSLEVNVISVADMKEVDNGSFSAIVRVSATTGHGDEQVLGKPINLQVVMHEGEDDWTLKSARYAKDKQNK